MNKEEFIKIDYELKDMIISALRYMLGRKTIGVYATANFIMEHTKLIDDRVKNVMLKDLEEYFNCRGIYYKDDECDYQVWKNLYEWLRTNG